MFDDRSSLLHIKQLFDDWVSYKRVSLPPFVAHEYFSLLVGRTSGNPKKILRKKAVGLSFRSRLDEPPGRRSTNWTGAVPGFCCQLLFRLWLEMHPPLQRQFFSLDALDSYRCALAACIAKPVADPSGWRADKVFAVSLTATSSR